ncbi:C-X-C motif chemokine 10 [Thamnophis elegans]|uniref:C-X-C motif chemokine 10 n=1 Tax=Thamnophis elegans TaxID=35005 RepID=UPI00137853D1|nr:C-X-C motif chemokine 10 [Thamnophis elegans]
MKNICAISLALVLLLAMGIEGIVTGQRSSCRCQSLSSKAIPPRFVTKFDVLPANSFCNTLEYIVTLKRGSQQCLDPTSKQVQTMYNKWKTLQSRRIPIRPQ